MTAQHAEATAARRSALQKAKQRPPAVRPAAATARAARPRGAQAVTADDFNDIMKEAGLGSERQGASPALRAPVPTPTLPLSEAPTQPAAPVTQKKRVAAAAAVIPAKGKGSDRVAEEAAARENVPQQKSGPAAVAEPHYLDLFDVAPCQASRQIDGAGASGAGQYGGAGGVAQTQSAATATQGPLAKRRKVLG